MFKESPIRITDSKDKANPNEITQDNSFRWIVGGIAAGVTIYFGTFYMLMSHVNSVLTTGYGTTVVIAAIMQWLIPIIYLALLVGVIYAIIRLIFISGTRQKLINVNTHQMTMDMLNSADTFRLALEKLEVEKTRAATIRYPDSVLSVQDSHNGGSNTYANTATPPSATNSDEGDYEMLEDLLSGKRGKK